MAAKSKPKKSLPTVKAPECEILGGDCLELLRTRKSKSVHMVVTSPPYYGLRCYGIPATKWGDGTECCLGHEPTLAEFIAHMVEIFREIRRVLRKDGTVWLNMGDSHAGKPGAGQGKNGYMVSRSVVQARNEARKIFNEEGQRNRARDTTGKGVLKPKQLMMVPHRLAIALQEDGWWVRMDNVWNKPNPMPESTKDRPARCHEYVFLLSRAPRYYYDAEAVKEPASPNTHLRVSQDVAGQAGSTRANGGTDARPMKAGGRSQAAMEFPGMGQRDEKRRRVPKVPAGWDSSTGNGGHGNFHKEGREPGVTPKAAEAFELDPRVKNNPDWAEAHQQLVSMRNFRSVWTVPTYSFKGAHFATFPPELVKPCILAGTSAGGCCHRCGRPYLRQTKKGQANLAHQKACGGDSDGEYHGESTKDYAKAGAQDASATKARILAGMVETITTGWKPQCRCKDSAPVPSIVLDPFGGSGTTGLVALENGRSALLMELKAEYRKLAHRRTLITPTMLLG